MPSGLADDTTDHDDDKDECDIQCAGDNGGIELPDGFCASVFADDLGSARHMAVTPSGDVFVAIQPPPGQIEGGRVVALRDADDDGIAEIEEQVLDFGGNGIAWSAGFLYVAQHHQIVKFSLADGSLDPQRMQTIVHDLPATGDHINKSIVVVGDDLYINIGSATNSCQVENRVLHSPGIDPCPELDVRAGIWRYSATQNQQCPDTTGERVVAGARNTVALAADERGMVWGAINGRDQLFENWPELFTEEQSLQLPAEEIIAVTDGADYGWPYCYYDPFQDAKVLAPEYGGDGEIIGRCAGKSMPSATLPAHWAPLGMAFYTERQFPERYQGGLFIANHGSRFDMQAMFDPGYNVVFLPFENGTPTGDWEPFAVGFAGDGLPLPAAALHRPVSIAMMPDGSMLISDDKGGRIWKVSYVGSDKPDA